MGRPERTARGARRLFLLSAALLALVALTWWFATAGQGDDASQVLGAPPKRADGSGAELQLDALGFDERAPQATVVAVPDVDGPAAVPDAGPGGVGAATLLGRVITPHGEPVPEADVIVATNDQALVDAIVAVLEARRLATEVVMPAASRRGLAVHGAANGEGEIEIALTPEQSVQLGARPLLLAAVRAPGDVGVFACAPLAGGENALGDLELPAGARLRVRLVDPDGVPVSGVTVQVDAPVWDDGPLSAARSRLRSRASAADGVADIAGLPAGSVAVRVDAYQWLSVRFPDLRLRAGALVDLGDFALDAGSALAGSVQTPDGSAVTAGRVVAVAESSVSGWHDGNIELQPRSETAASIDEHGRFEVEGLGPGLHTLYVAVPGFATQEVAGASAGQRDLEITLRGLARAQLTVLDARTSAPLEGAEISAVTSPAELRGHFRREPIVVQSGAASGFAPGLYEVQGVGLDGARLTIRAAGHALGLVDVPPLAPDAAWSVTCRLERGLVLRGQVVDLDAQPIADAEIRAEAGGELSKLVGLRQATSDAAGVFELSDLVAGTWTFEATAPGFIGSARTPVELSGEDIDGALVRLAPESRVSGLVGDPTGRSLARAAVRSCIVEILPPRPLAGSKPVVLIESSFDEATVSTRSSSDGAYALAPLVPGVHLVGASTLSDRPFAVRMSSLAVLARDPSASLPEDVVRVVLELGERRELRLVAVPPAILHGRVLSGGAPVPAAPVFVAPTYAEEGEWLAEGLADDEGRYRITGLPPGPTLVAAIVEGEALPRARLIDLQAGVELAADFEFDGPTIHGLVIDTSTGLPASDVALRVHWKPPESAADAKSPMSAEARAALGRQGYRPPLLRSDAAGRFELRHLLAGECLVGPDGDEWLSVSKDRFTVDEHWGAEDIVVRLSPGAVVEGTVEDTFGTPVDGGSHEFEIGLYVPDREAVAQWTYLQDGHYRLQGLHAGSYELRVRDLRSGGGLLHRQPVTLADDQRLRLDIKLEE